MRYITLLLLLLSCLGEVYADAVVTLCNVDTQPGAGLNFRDAVSNGGRITFACPSQTTLRITQVHNLGEVIEIDGKNKISLDGGDSTSIFESRVGAPGRVLTLRNLIILRGRSLPFKFDTGAITIGFQLPSNMVVLDHIKIMDTERPVSVHQGTLVVRDSQFITNTGPVLNMGDSFGVVKKNLEVSNSTFKQNFGSAFLTFGANVTIDATEVIGRSDETDRGSIFFDGTLKIRNSHFNNIWGGSQCGGALQSSSRTTIANSSFNNNRSNCGGGAAWFFGEPQEVDLRAVTYTDNQTTGLGGAVLIELNNPAEIQIRHGEFRNNRADVGGAIYFSTRFGHLGIRATALSFKGNSAEKLGGAVYVKDSGFQLTRGIFVDNKSSTGGVIMFEGTNPPPFVIANSLVARNKSPSAIQGFTGDIINSTIADNDSLGLSVSGHLRLTNTVISNNKKHNCHTASLGGLIEDRGGNLQFPGTDCSSTIPSADPDLDSFYVPDLDSPLQRAGINDVCLAKPIGGQDVYGQRRPRADRCTIGAVEGDIEQILHHIGVTGTKAPPGEGGGGEGGATGSSGDGENTLIVPLEWCVLLILFLIVALLLLYIKMKTP